MTNRSTTRRRFLATTCVATTAMMSPARGWAFGRGLGPDADDSGHPRFDDPDIKALAHRALEAATAAGASYADFRVTDTRRQKFLNREVEDSDFTAIGVRALVNGAWGFASHAELTAESVEWIGRTAATLGRANAWSHVAPIELGERVSEVGTWQMSVQRDPLTIPVEEKSAFLAELDKTIGAAFQQRGLKGYFKFQANFERQSRTFVSTEGAFLTQTVYNTLGANVAGRGSGAESMFAVMQKDGPLYASSSFSPVGKGFEVLEPLIVEVPQLVERAVELANAKSFDTPGRYDVVFDGYAVAALVSTLGRALEVDRVLGYEAMTSGTSYLTPLEQRFGTAHLPPNVTITANRTMPGGVATVQWDDEGIRTQEFPLFQEGMLLDCATGREFVPEVAAWYRKQKYALRSRGCMTAESAKGMPVVQTPNLILQPGASNLSFTELLAGIQNGFAVLGGDVDMDQQLLTGMGTGAIMYAVKNGALAGAVSDAAYLFRLPEFWKGLVALGGMGTMVTRGFTVTKGEPRQQMPHSVQAVAARFKDVAIRAVGNTGFDLQKMLGG